MFSDKNTLCCQMDKLIQLHVYDVDISTDAEVVFVGEALKQDRWHLLSLKPVL